MQKRVYTAWTEEEQEKFTTLFQTYKKDFQEYLAHLPGRSKLQVKSFYYNTLKKNKLVKERAPQKEEESTQERPFWMDDEVWDYFE